MNFIENGEPASAGAATDCSQLATYIFAKSTSYRDRQRESSMLVTPFGLVYIVCFTRKLFVECSYADELYEEVSAFSNSSLFWGPYRPNLYVGIRPRLPESLLAGLMWSNVDDYENYQDLRHSCEQGDDISSYGWEQFDARRGGKHVVRDKKMGIDLWTELVKLPGNKHDDWALRVKGVPRPDSSSDIHSAIIFYAGLEGNGSLELWNPDFDDITTGIAGTAKLSGNSPELGRFAIEVRESSELNTHPQSDHVLSHTRDLSRTSFLSLKVPGGLIWQAKEILLQAIRQPLLKIQEKFGTDNLPHPSILFSLPNEGGPGSNLHYFQKVFEGAFQFDVIFEAISDSGKGVRTPVTEDVISNTLLDMNEDFDRKFEHVFHLTAPFESDRYRKFGKVLFSNLLGGIGYFHGTSIVDRSYSSSYDEDDELFWENAAAQLAAGPGKEEGPSELFTAVPSRAFFPRGFYWDEGFHLIPIGLWDQDLSLEIIKSWFSLMDEDGWIGREQILGLEARSKVPPEFTTQYPHYANPPTLFIAIDQFLKRTKQQKNIIEGKEYDAQQVFDQSFSVPSSSSRYLENPELALHYLRGLYPQLKKHYEWFRRTQAGEIKAYDREAFSKKEGYRWRGRTPDHCLTSGIDDYPRARPPHPGELHLDLHSWMGLMTRLLRNIAEQVDEAEDALELSRIEESLRRNLDDLHWSDREQAYCDQTIDEYEENVPVCHLGYISIFPVLLGLLPADHEHLGAVLNLMHNEQHLWSPFGLRSLSKQDPYYGTGENYWRGPIWININYLALSSLYHNYINEAGPYQELAREIYDQLRINIVNVVENEFRKSGIFWEQYDPETGRGQRTKGFTGWTSMVVNIMAEQY